MNECFLHLNKNTVEEILLSKTENIQGDYLVNSLVHFEKLDTLSFFGCQENPCDYIAQCISLCLNLKKLHISSIDNCSMENLVKSICLLKNLQFLQLSKLRENFIPDICCNLLELKKLNLTDYMITDSDLQLISNLPKLEGLNISGNFLVTGEGLEKFTNLKALICKRCKRLKEDGLIKLLKCSNNLEILQIQDCYKLTSNILRVIYEVKKTVL